LDFLGDKVMKAAGWNVGSTEVMDYLVIIIVAILVYPFCIIKNFHKI